MQRPKIKLRWAKVIWKCANGVVSCGNDVAERGSALVVNLCKFAVRWSEFAMDLCKVAARWSKIAVDLCKFAAHGSRMHRTRAGLH